MIEFENVTYRYPFGKDVIKNVNLSIHQAEIAAIVGNNGSGKTTLIRHTNGLLKPTYGKVMVFGIDTKKSTVASLSKRVGIVFQNPNNQLFSDTVENEVLFGLKHFHSVEFAKKRLEWALEFFNLKEYRNHVPTNLSEGEKKRLCFAAVLSWDPDIIILDEPTVGQDFLQKEKLIMFLKMLHSERKTIILVSHDMDFIWRFQPRIIVISEGSIIFDQKASQLFNNPEIKRANLIEPQLVSIYQKLQIKPKNMFTDISNTVYWIRNNFLET